MVRCIIWIGLKIKYQIKLIGLIFIITFHSIDIYSQEKNKTFPFGVLFYPGVTSGNSQVQQINRNNYISKGFGFYGLVPVVSFDSANRTGGFLRGSFGFEEKGGSFEVSGGQLAGVTTSYIDLNVLGHIVADIENMVRAYTGLGFSLGYVIRKEIVPSQLKSSFDSGSKLVFGTSFELGFILGPSSYIGIRTLISSTSNTKYNGTSIVLGISPQPTKKKRKVML